MLVELMAKGYPEPAIYNKRSLLQEAERLPQRIITAATAIFKLQPRLHFAICRQNFDAFCFDGALLRFSQGGSAFTEDWGLN